MRKLPQNLICEFNLGPAIEEMSRLGMSMPAYKSNLGRVDVDELDGLPEEDMTQPLLDQGEYGQLWNCPRVVHNADFYHFSLLRLNQCHWY